MAEYLEPYYQIGEVAQISGVSILTLRYYDKINLLKPAYIDESKYAGIILKDRFIFSA